MADVIAAVSTALAPSGIGVIRLSGDGAAEVAAKVLRPVTGLTLPEAPNRKLVLQDLQDRRGRTIDRILAVYTRGPHSYTGEDTVELQCHGSPAVLTEALQALFAAGARQAGPGEFTKRAFLNGRMDLTAAEAVIDLIEAETADAAANAAGQVGGALLRRLEPVYNELVQIMSHFHAVLDYPDEDIDDFHLQDYMGVLQTQQAALEGLLATCRRGSVVKNGVRAVILGKPNAGKSSLLNALAGYERVIVTDIPGTTRDTVEEKLKLGGVLLRLIDTAGIRDTADTVEQLGVRRAVEAAEGADLALVVLDASRPLEDEDLRAIAAAAGADNSICLLNKTDQPSVVTPDAEALKGFAHCLNISARTGQGLEVLEQLVGERFEAGPPCDGTLLTNSRHISAVTRARDAIAMTLEAMAAGETPDAVLVEVELALEAIADLTGRSMREDITSDIFSRFCVGK